MKKFLHKDKKDKEEKKKEKKEKKEKKDKSKKSKKDKQSASTSSLEEVPESPEPASQSTTEVTKTTIPSDGAAKTITVKETVKERSGQRVSKTEIEENVSVDVGGEIKKTTTTTITESKPDQPIETKTVVKETTNKTPQREEKVVVTKTSSQVQSVPSTREFLTKKFLKSDGIETTKYMQPGQQDSERTVIREVSDGGQTVKTITKVVSDEGGKRETTVTTSLGKKNEGRENVKVDSSPQQEDEGEQGIISEVVERKADLPEWLDNIPHTSTPKYKVKIDDSIEIPSPPLQKKEPHEKLKQTGPKVVEEILPVEDSKENIMDLLDDLGNSGKAKPKEEKPKTLEDIPFTYEPKKSEKKVYTGVPVTEKVDTVNKAETAEIDFASLERRKEPKPARTVQQIHTRKAISTNGDAVETQVTVETVTDEQGKVKKTETKTISGPGQKPMQSHDIDYNVETKKDTTSPEISKRNLHDETATKNAKNVIEIDEDDNDDDNEILEEIIVIEKKRKVRIPKSFVPYEKERPKAVLPIDMLIERQSRPRKLPPVGRRVDEKVEEHNQIRKSEIPDLDELDVLLSAIEVERK